MDVDGWLPADLADRGVCWGMTFSLATSSLSLSRARVCRKNVVG